MSERKYNSIYSIKDMAINEIAPKFLNLEEINTSNVGIFGYFTDLVSNITEDTFNIVSTYINEMFPNKAQLSESIFTYASLFEIDAMFARPSEMSMAILVNENDIVKYGTVRPTHLEFTLDSDLIIDIEGKHFMLDYDVKINAKPYSGDYIFSAVYDKNFNNTISDIKNPYIRVKRLNYNSDKYLALLLKVRQVDKDEVNEYLISNDKINIPTINFTFNNQIANFEVFYKVGDSEFIQLTKKMLNTSPLPTPFCFYKFKNEREIELSFSTKEKYFQPEFNSEFLIRVFTTTGQAGDFPLYSGSNVNLIPSSDIYDYNNSIVLLGIVQSKSGFGANMLATEDLKNKVIESFSTVKSITTENDLNLFFSNYLRQQYTDMMFIKKRDDVFERLFSSFMLLKTDEDVIPTNTLDMIIDPIDFDYEYEQSNRYLLKAGHLFKYRSGDRNILEMIPSSFIYDTDLDTLGEEFVYTNPFLTTVTKSPSIVGFYVNSIDSSHLMDYTYVNINSSVQFICNTILVKRNAINNENQYKIRLDVLPTIELDPTMAIVDETGTYLETLKVVAFFEVGGAESYYTVFDFVEFNTTSGLYTFEASITTDDYITETEKIRITDLNDVGDNSTGIFYIPMIDCKVNIRTFFRYPDIGTVVHTYTNIPTLDEYILTNTYETVEEPITFIKPLNMIKGTSVYIDNGDTTYSFNLKSIPKVSAEYLKESNNLSHFMSSILDAYSYLQGALDSVTNNYYIDIKFFNTYGKSRNFAIGDNADILLDKVNLSIYFKVKPLPAVDETILVRDMKIFIKDYIEEINIGGSPTTNYVYISNLMRALESTFSDILYVKFDRINSYDSSEQAITNTADDLNKLTKEERKVFVPELLVVNVDDIHITVLVD